MNYEFQGLKDNNEIVEKPHKKVNYLIHFIDTVFTEVVRILAVENWNCWIIEFSGYSSGQLQYAYIKNL